MDNECSEDGQFAVLSRLSTAAMERLDSACLRFEGEWQNAKQPVLEEYLGEVPALEAGPLLIELVKLDLYYRRQAGEAISAADYSLRFPQYRLQVEQFAAQSEAAERDTAEDARAAIEATASEKRDAPLPESVEEFPAPLIPGYEIGAILGRGAMGVVYLARHVAVNRQVALKTILRNKLASADAAARFLSEAEAVAALQHPNIVQIFELGRHFEQPFIALEYISGGSLAQKLKSGSVPPRVAARLVEQLARGVNAAHLAGIVHRDLKPSNILLTSDGTAKITDFGLAKRLQRDGDLTHFGIIVGTPTYMAPEQAQGKRVGPAADIYALGVILYECLTGRPPFKSDTILETMRRVVEEDPTPLRCLRPNLPYDLQSICLKCLNKQPQKRYASAEALADDLRCWQENKPVKARPVGAIELMAKWVRRRPSLAALTAALLLFLIGGIWWSTEFARRQADLAVRQTYLNREVSAAVEEAEKQQQALTARLQDSIRVQELLCDLTQWHGALDRIQADLRRGQSLADGAPELLSQELADRLRTLRAQLAIDVRAYQLADRLDAIRLDIFQSSDEQFDTQASAELKYRSVFQEVGLEVDQRTDLESLADVVRQSPARHALIAALDFWALAMRDEPLKSRLLAVARLADPDPWRDQVRDPRNWQNRQALRQLASEANLVHQSSQIVLTLVGVIARSKGDPLPLLRKASLSHPQDFWILFTLAFHCEQRSEAIAYYQAALAIRPNSSTALHNLGMALRAYKDYAGAISCFKKIIQLDNSNAAAHLGLGNVLLAYRDLEGAKFHFEKAIHLVPGSAKAHNNLGVALFASDDLAGAIVCYEKALRIDSHYAPAHNNLGNALKARKDLKGAMASYKKAIEFDPENASAHCNLGLTLFESQEIMAAIECYKKSAARDSSYAPAHYNLGVALYKIGDVAGAIAAFEKAVIYDPANAQAHNNLGVAFRQQQNFPAAIAAFEKAVAHDPKWAIAYNNLGGALHATGQVAPAIAAFEKALVCDPQYAVAHCNLGNVRYAQGDKLAALGSYKKAVAADPKDALAHSLVGQMLRERGEFAEALEELKIGHELGSRQPGWFDPAALTIKQCEELLALDRKLGRVLDGEDQADTAEERLALADLCFTYKSRYVDAVSFYTAAFSAAPGIVSDVRKLNRYHAASAAALAASGLGKDASQLDEGAKRKMRQQALEWLSADLALWEVLARSEEPAARQLVIQQLSHWQADSHLASIREVKMLDFLPERERAPWRRLWASVADTIQKSKS